MSIKSLENLGKAWLDLIKAYKNLFFLDLDLARQSFIPFCFIALLFIAVVGAFALMSLAVIVYFVYAYTFNWLIALLSAELISVINALLVFFFLRQYFHQLIFEHFRAQLKKVPTQEDAQNESDKIAQAKN